MMQRTLIPILCSVLALPAPVHALQLREGRDNAQITAVISAQEVSRIALEHDHIRMVSGNPEVSTVHDANTGNVYIQPTMPGAKKPVNLFVSTEKGFTYHLLLVPEDVPSEQVLIHNPDLMQGVPEEAMDWEKAAPYQETIIKMMRAMLTRGTLPGFQWEGVSGQHSVSGLDIEDKSLFTSSTLQGHVRLVSNNTATTRALSEALFWRPGDLATHILKPRIGAGETTLVYSISERLSRAETGPETRRGSKPGARPESGQ